LDYGKRGLGEGANRGWTKTVAYTVMVIPEEEWTGGRDLWEEGRGLAGSREQRGARGGRERRAGQQAPLIDAVIQVLLSRRVAHTLSPARNPHLPVRPGSRSVPASTQEPPTGPASQPFCRAAAKVSHNYRFSGGPTYRSNPRTQSFRSPPARFLPGPHSRPHIHLHSLYENSYRVLALRVTDMDGKIWPPSAFLDPHPRYKDSSNLSSQLFWVEASKTNDRGVRVKAAGRGSGFRPLSQSPN
jgi:hypothetical protein